MMEWYIYANYQKERSVLYLNRSYLLGEEVDGVGRLYSNVSNNNRRQDIDRVRRWQICRH
jgi:hypothetical protein